MRYRVVGVQYYIYNTEAESEADAFEGFRTMMHYGTDCEISQLKHGDPIAVKAIELDGKE